MPRKSIVIAISIVFALVVYVMRNPRSVPSGTTDHQEKAPAQSTAAPGQSFRVDVSVSATTNQRLLTLGQRLARRVDGVDADEDRLTAPEIAIYLARNQTNALSLVTAFQATTDREFLRQAAAAFPDDPLVQAKVLMHNLYPEERQQWIDALKKSSPENSLPNFLAARDMMDQANATGALAEITSAANKNFNDYTRESSIGLEEAYLEAGRTPAEAKALGSSEILLPELAPLKKLGAELADLAEQYGNAGDAASRQALLEGVYQMGTQLRESGKQGTLLNSLVGLALQNITLQRWPEGVPAELIQGSVADQLAANRQYRQNVRANAQLFGQWLPTAPDNEIVAYYDRIKAFSEENAMQWLRTRHPEFIPSPSTR